MLNVIKKTALTTLTAIALTGGLSVQAQAMTTSFKANSSVKASQSFNSGRSLNTRRSANNSRSVNRRGVNSNRSRSGFNRSNIGFSRGYYTRSRLSNRGYGHSRSNSGYYGSGRYSRRGRGHSGFGGIAIRLGGYGYGGGY